LKLFDVQFDKTEHHIMKVVAYFLSFWQCCRKTIYEIRRN